MNEREERDTDVAEQGYLEFIQAELKTVRRMLTLARERISTSNRAGISDLLDDVQGRLANVLTVLPRSGLPKSVEADAHHAGRELSNAVRELSNALQTFERTSGACPVIGLSR